MKQLLDKMPTSTSVSDCFIEKVSASCEGLTGAWLSEIATSRLINSLVENRTKISKDDLVASAKEVMDRRGLAYRINSYEPKNTKQQEVYVR